MLRHACGYALANAGHDTRSLQDYLGHKNIQHTVRYTELAPTLAFISHSSSASRVTAGAAGFSDLQPASAINRHPTGHGPKDAGVYRSLKQTQPVSSPLAATMADGDANRQPCGFGNELAN